MILTFLCFIVVPVLTSMAGGQNAAPQMDADCAGPLCDSSSFIQMNKLHMSNSEKTKPEVMSEETADFRNVERQLRQVYRGMPSILRSSASVAGALNGEHRILDALLNATNSRPSNKSSFRDLERRVEAAMVETGALQEVKKVTRAAQDFAKTDTDFRRKTLGTFGIDSLNLGIARSFSPWYEPLYVFPNWELADEAPVKGVGSIAAWLAMKYISDTSDKEAGVDFEVKAGYWRICFAVSGGAQMFISRSTFKGSEFGGEDFYIGWQVSSRETGWSWGIDLNRDYMLHEFNDKTHKWETPEVVWANRWWGMRAQLSRITGGVEFTSRNLFIGVNLEYCIMGRSQGGECIMRTDYSEAAEMKKAAQAFYESERQIQERDPYEDGDDDEVVEYEQASSHDLTQASRSHFPSEASHLHSHIPSDVRRPSAIPETAHLDISPRSTSSSVAPEPFPALRTSSRGHSHMTLPGSLEDEDGLRPPTPTHEDDIGDEDRLAVERRPSSRGSEGFVHSRHVPLPLEEVSSRPPTPTHEDDIGDEDGLAVERRSGSTHVSFAEDDRDDHDDERHTDSFSSLNVENPAADDPTSKRDPCSEQVRKYPKGAPRWYINLDTWTCRGRRWAFDKLLQSTVEGGVGHCWCSTWKKDLDISVW